MNEHLHDRIQELLSISEQVILATCGPAGPQVSVVTGQMSHGCFLLYVERASDHLFNLEQKPDLTALTTGWELHGRGEAMPDGMFSPPRPWQLVVRVKPTRMHLLDPVRRHRIETIDFEAEPPEDGSGYPNR